jgi:hypothetical protein
LQLIEVQKRSPEMQRKHGSRHVLKQQRHRLLMLQLGAANI